MGSTDFTGTTWTKTKNNWYDTSASPVVTTGDKAMTWGCNVWENNTDPTVDSTYGFESLWSGAAQAKPRNPLCTLRDMTAEVQETATTSFTY
jgi:hypothetical protein